MRHVSIASTDAGWLSSRPPHCTSLRVQPLSTISRPLARVTRFAATSSVAATTASPTITIPTVPFTATSIITATASLIGSGAPVRSFSAVARSAASRSSSPASSSVLPSSFDLRVALRLLTACHSVPAPASVELLVNLNLDPRKPNQSVRATCLLPHGTGQRLTIAVFARGEKAKEALAAGADIVGAEDLVARIQGGDVSFDRCLATPDCMALAGRVARVLGPRGLMPNPKLGSVTADVTRAIQSARQGQVEFKTDKSGVVHVGCGRLAFGPDKLADNVAAVARAIVAAKPSGAKGQYLRSAFLHSTHGPSVPLDIRLEPFKTNLSRVAPAAPVTTAVST